MKEEDERKVLDAATVVTNVFPQFDRRLELLEEQSGRVPDQIEGLHSRITDTNKQLNATADGLKKQMEDLSKQMLGLNESMLGLTSAVQQWEGAQRILAEATATSVIPSKNGHEKPAEENGDNGNGNGNGKEEKEKRKLYESIGRVVYWIGSAAFSSPKRIAATSTLAVLLGGGGLMAYVKGCAANVRPPAAFVGPVAPTTTPIGNTGR